MLGLVALAAGLVPVLRWRPFCIWVEYHAYFTCWSYIGLVAAAVAEITVRLLPMPFVSGVVGSSVGVIFGGYVVVRTRLPRVPREWTRKMSA